MLAYADPGILETPRRDGATAAQIATQEKLDKAIALANDRIDKINGDPSISPDDKRKLISQLNSAKASGNVDIIANAVSHVQSETSVASANASYEYLGNAGVAQSMMTGTFNIDTARGRHDFARSLLGPNQSRELENAVADEIQNNPQVNATARKWSQASPEQRAEMTAQRDKNVNEVRELAHRLEQRAGISQEEKTYLHELAAGDESHTHVRGHGRTLAALHRYEQTGNLAEAKQVTEGIEAHRSTNQRHIKANLIAQGVSPAKAERDSAIAADKLAAVESQVEAQISRGVSLNAKINIGQEVEQWGEFNSKDNAVRVQAYMKAYNEIEAKQGRTVDQEALKKTAEEYVQGHAAKAQLLSKDTFRALVDQSDDGLSATATKAEKEQKQLEAAERMHEIMLAKGSGYSKAEADSYYTTITDTVKNVTTAVTTVGSGAAAILTQDAKGIDAKGRGTGIMAKKVASALGASEETAQNFGHNVTVMAQGAGHTIASTIHAAAHPIDTAQAAGTAVYNAGASAVNSVTSTASSLYNWATGTKPAPAAPTPQQQAAAHARMRNAMDLNHDGSTTAAEVQASRAQADKDHNGTITQAERQAFLASHPARPATVQQPASASVSPAQAEINRVRAAVDKDHDGKLSAAEIGAYLSAHGVTAKQADKDGKGLSNGDLVAVSHMPTQAAARPAAKGH